jgi:hypothetical protein
MHDRASHRFRPSRLLRAALVGALAAAASLAAGCIFSDEQPIDEGIVRSEQADVYSSTALVALKVTTLKRGDTVDILRREAITGPTSTENWLQIRLKDDADTSGWIEARHVVSESVVKKTEEVAGGDQAIARGRLKVNQKLRLAAGRDSDVAAVLSRGTEFDIVGKAQTRAKTDKKPKPGTAADNSAADDAPDEPDDEEDAPTDVWYRVRLDEGSIIRGGWLLAQSVSLEVPDEILHLEGEGRRFVAWQVVGTVTDSKLAERDPNNAKRNNYVTFMRRASAPDEVDFERIYCLFWDPDAHTYYAPYVDSDLRGVFPVTQRDEGGRKIVTLNVLDEQNKPTPVELEVVPGDKGRLTVRRTTPPVRGEKMAGRRR